MELCINFSLHFAFSSFTMEEFEYSHTSIKAKIRSVIWFMVDTLILYLYVVKFTLSAVS